MKPQEAIKLLQELDPDEDLLITWWSNDDWEQYADKEGAFELAEQQLEQCIGHINEWIEMSIERNEEEEGE